MSAAENSVWRNPALMLTWGLPLAAVAASVLTMVITFAHPEGELPEQYHWEGFQLDRDFSRGERAGKLRVKATITGLEQGGRCVLELSLDVAPPPALVLRVAHATLPSRDQHLAFRRVTTDRAGIYAAECQAAPSGHWRLELSDEAGTWALRSNLRGSPQVAVLDAAPSATTD